MDHFQANKFTGKCYRCGKPVAVGEGTFRYVSAESLGRKAVGTRNSDIGILEHVSCREAHDGTGFSYLFPPVVRVDG